MKRTHNPTKFPGKTGDQIVYLVLSNPGGIDGRDTSDKGGTIKFASFVKLEAENNTDKWSTVTPKIVNVETQRAETLKKVNPLDLLILGLEKDGSPSKPIITTRED
jgi:hypothetical protein